MCSPQASDGFVSGVVLPQDSDRYAQPSRWPCPRYALVMDDESWNGYIMDEASLWPYGSMSARCQLLLRDFEAQQWHLSNLEQETNTFRHHGARETLRDRGCATRSFVLWLNVVQLKIKPVFLEIMMHGPSTDGGMTFNFV